MAAMLNRRNRRALNQKLGRPRNAPLKIIKWTTEILREWEENGIKHNSHRHHFSITSAGEATHTHTQTTFAVKPGENCTAEHFHSVTVDAGSSHTHIFSGYTGITTASDLSHTHTISITSQAGTTHSHGFPTPWPEGGCAQCEGSEHEHAAEGDNSQEATHTHELSNPTDVATGLLRWHKHSIDVPSDAGLAHSHDGGTGTIEEVSCNEGYLHDHNDVINTSSEESAHTHDVVGDTDEEGEPIDGAEPLYARFEVGQGSADLKASFDGQTTEDLLGEFIVQQSDSEQLLGEFIVQQSDLETLLAGFIVQHKDEEELLAEFIAQQISSETLLCGFTAQQPSSETLLCGFTVQPASSEQLLGEFIAQQVSSEMLLCGFIVQPASSETLLAEFIVQHTASRNLKAGFEGQVSLNLLGKFIVQQASSETLLGEFVTQHADSEILLCGFTVQHKAGVSDPKGIFTVQHKDEEILLGKFIVRPSSSEDLLGEFIVRHAASEELHGAFDVQAVASLPAKFSAIRSAAFQIHAGFVINQASEDLHGEFISRQSGSRTLLGKVNIVHCIDLGAEFEVQHGNSINLLGAMISRHADFENLPAEFFVRNASTANLLGKVIVQHSFTGVGIVIAYDPYAFFNYSRNIGTGFLMTPATAPDKQTKIIGESSLKSRIGYAPHRHDYITFGWKYRYPQLPIGRKNLKGCFQVRQSSTVSLKAQFEVGQNSQNLKCGFEIW